MSLLTTEMKGMLLTAITNFILDETGVKLINDDCGRYQLKREILLAVDDLQRTYFEVEQCKDLHTRVTIKLIGE